MNDWLAATRGNFYLIWLSFMILSILDDILLVSLLYASSVLVLLLLIAIF